MPISLISHRLNQALKSAKASADEEEYSFLRTWFKEEPKPAAVLLPLFSDHHEWHLLFTRRNSNLEEHSGQVAFPGGRVDDSDATPEGAALREAYEEIGLHSQDVRILGRLKRLLTVTNYAVTPIVGVIPWPYPLNLSPYEVSKVFSIPLHWLADKKNYEIQTRQLFSLNKPIPVIIYHEYQGEVLWGASARIVHCFLEALQLLEK